MTGAPIHRGSIDWLTGLPNYRAARATLPVELEGGGAGAAIFCDMTGMKRFNDRNGHAAGDELLRRVAAILVAATPDGSSAYRFGGDGFFVWLPSVDGVTGYALAQDIRVSISKVLDDMPLEYPPPWPMTASFVVVAWAERATPDFEALLRVLSEALPRNRNTVVWIDTESIKFAQPSV